MSIAVASRPSTPQFLATPAAVPAARNYAQQCVAGWVSGDLLMAILLVVTEFATNAVKAYGFDAKETFRVYIQLDRGTIVVAVEDGAPGRPRFDPEVGPDDVSGRGLQIVRLLASECGLEERPSGRKVLWARLEAPVAAPCDASTATLS